MNTSANGFSIPAGDQPAWRSPLTNFTALRIQAGGERGFIEAEGFQTQLRTCLPELLRVLNKVLTKWQPYALLR